EVRRDRSPPARDDAWNDVTPEERPRWLAMEEQDGLPAPLVNEVHPQVVQLEPVWRERIVRQPGEALVHAPSVSATRAATRPWRDLGRQLDGGLDKRLGASDAHHRRAEHPAE